MKRRTLDLMFSFGGMGLAVLMLILGVALTSNANFAKSYVKDQLSAQKINFKPAAALSEEEKASACLVEYAGQAVTTGKQAECYANDFIGLHVSAIAEGRTYASQGDYVNGLKAELATAQKATPVDEAKIADLNAQITAGGLARDSLFKGETLRGLLLTSYGFSVFGVKGGEVATVAFIVAGLLFLLSLAGMAHAYRTPKSKGFAIPESVPSNGKKVMVNA